MSEPTGTTILPGTEIAGYRIERELGRGSMAVVYRAVQLNLLRPVALKVLSAELASNHEFVGRFFNEARAAAALSHANIIQAYDAGQTDGGIYFFAMEYVEGETVQDRILREGSIPVRAALRMAGDIADALNYGWQRQRLTHGDIKPDNIMVNTEGETKLADFGLAKVADHDFAGTDLMLTPHYASPEAIRGKLEKDDCRGDIYSFGATLYHMLAGHPPFPGQSTDEVLERHLAELPPPLAGQVPDLPAGVSDFVAALLDKDPAGRPQDWNEVLGKIRALARDKQAPVHKLRMGSKDGVRRPVVVHRPRSGVGSLLPFLLVLAMLVLGFAAFVVFRPTPFPATPEDAFLQVPEEPPQEPVAAEKPPAPPPDGEAEQAAAREHVQNLWAELQVRLREFSGEPEEGVAALESFAAEHRGVWLPSDFSDQLKNYRDAVEVRVAEPPPNVNPPEEVAVAPPSAEPIPEGRELPQSRAAQREDAFLLLCAQIRAFPYRPGGSVERLQQWATSWLETYPEESARRTLVVLVAESLLPALDECVPRLVANQRRLLDKPFAVDRRTQGSIQELTLDHLTIGERTPHGSMRRRLPWAEFGDLRPVLALVNMAFGNPAPSARDRQLQLALALMSRDEALWRATTASLAAEPDLRDWQVLRQEIMQAEREGPAVELWIRLRQSFLSGSEDARSYRMARELQNTRTATANRYQAELAKIMDLCAEALPDIRAGRLVREAQENLATAPYETLRALGVVRVRYGALDFPERGQIEAIRTRALASVERPDALLRTIERWPAYAFCTQLHGSWGEPPHIAMLAYEVLAAKDNLAPAHRSLLLPGQFVGLVEIGDWGAAADLLPRLELTRAVMPVRDFRGSAAFAVGLLGERFPRRALDLDPLEIIRQAVAETGGRPEATVQLATALADCALVTRRCHEPEAELILAETVEQAPLVQARSNFALAALAVHLEAGRNARAAELLAEFEEDSQRARAYGFNRRQVALLQSLGDYVAGRGGLAGESMALPFANYEHFFRLAVSALCTRPGDAGPAAERLAADAVSRADGLGPVGGSALYDLLLLRLSLALEAGDLAAAQRLVEAELAATSTARHPYYPRLLFLKAGLARLAGDTGRLSTIAEQMGGATVANSGERLLAALLDPGYPRERVQRELPRVGSRNLRFWGEWLEITLRIAHSPPEQRARLAHSIHVEQCAPAERLLVPALAKYYLR